MYLRFYGLRQEPFSIAPDPRFLYLSPRHREALAHLRYGLSSSGGFVVLTGEIGAGKTTVCRCLLEQVPAQCNVAYVFNPKLTVRELLRTVCADFGIPSPREDARTASLKDYIDALNDFLLARHAAGEHNVLIVDEAQALPPDLLEQLRLLTNLETHERKLLQIVLIGQPELRDMLAQPQMEQLAQRVVARFHLGTLTERETAHYIRHRLTVAGLEGALPFSVEAIKRIHELARGVPRRINLLCDRALLGGYASGRQPVDRAIVDKAAVEVFGQDAPPRSRTPDWRWAAAGGLALGVLGAVVAGAMWRAGSTSGNAAGPAAQPVPAAAPAASAPAAAPPASTAASGAAAAASATPDAAVPRLADAGALQAWLSSHAATREPQAWQALAALWGASPPAEAAPCNVLPREDLHCFKRRIDLPELLALDRPAILPLYGTDGLARHALLVGASESALWLRAGQRDAWVAKSLIDGPWRQEFGTLWRAPPGTRVDGGGQITTYAAHWVNAQLADLPGEGERAKLRAFQRQVGLDADGLVGALTLMQLARKAGMNEPRLRRE